MSKAATRSTRLLLLLTSAAAFSACSDTPTTSHAAPQLPTSVSNGAAVNVQLLKCAALVSIRAVSCAPATSSGGASADVIIGGQGQFVQLASSNIQYSAGIFSFDVTVQNLIPQALNTTDGTTADAGGVRVFFTSGPNVVAGTGNASVQNADGTGVFTSAGQPYFQYSGGLLGGDGILTTNEVSGSKNWHLAVDPTVTQFSFTVLVSTTVQHPMGYVAMSKDSNFVNAGGTDALTATVRNFAGEPASGAPAVTWGTTNSAVATVDGSGHVTAVAPGLATITATSDTLVGRTTIQVCPAFGSVGSSFVFTGADAASVCMAGGGSAAAEYVAVPFNGATSGSAGMSFLGTGIVAAAGPPNPNRIPAQRKLALGPVGSATDGEISGHLALMQKLAYGVKTSAGMTFASTPVRHGISSKMMTKSGVAPTGPSRVIVGGTNYVVGDPIDLDVSLACNGPADVRHGTVRSRSAHALIVSDNAAPANGFSTAQFDSIAAEFDTIAYAVTANVFTPPTNEDAIGAVVIFFTNAVNELNTNGTSTPTYAYFNPKDMHLTTGAAACSSSNTGEMLYVAIPDSTGSINGNALTASTLRPMLQRLLTHNLIHLARNWHRAWELLIIPFVPEEPWLEEAMANAGEEFAFMKAAGLNFRLNITGAAVTATTPIQDAFNTYQAGNFSRLGRWLSAPDTAGPYMHDVGAEFGPIPSTASTGAAWAFLRYATDRLNGNELNFWQSLASSTTTGLTNVQGAIGGADPLVWARDFAVAMYTDDAVSGVGPEYLATTWNYRSVFTTINASYPLHTTPLNNGVAAPVTLTYGGAAYLRLGVPSTGFARLTSSLGGGAPNSSFSLTVVRTK